MNKTILIKPLLTEKTIFLARTGWFTFLVDRHAQKREIRKAVEQEFKVHVIDVKTAMIHTKPRRVGKLRLIKSAVVRKKAMARLKENEKIDLFTIEQPVNK
ncbi:50S ribosomal protein L23 [Candidatus Gottesmanbacteria bacterium]|nr:50S ribosomal protein L23 [Candidatus Gottesmanbacteria bacterium]